MIAELTKKQQAVYKAEGMTAFEAGKDSNDCPYPGLVSNNNDERGSWLHGWWKSFYFQRDQDLLAVYNWLEYANDAPNQVGTLGGSTALAKMVVYAGDFDRTKPVPVKIGSLEFTIPAPDTLERKKG